MANDKIETEIKANQPVNSRTLADNTEKTEGPEVKFDAHSTAVMNFSLMGADTRKKLDIMLQNINKTVDDFGTEKGDGSFFPYTPADLELGVNISMRAGNYTTGEKDDKGKNIYKPHLALPAQVTISDPNNWMNNVQLDILQLIKLNKYISNVLEANRPAVSYYVSLQKEIKQRKIDEDLGF